MDQLRREMSKENSMNNSLGIASKLLDEVNSMAHKELWAKTQVISVEIRDDSTRTFHNMGYGHNLNEALGTHVMPFVKVAMANDAPSPTMRLVDEDGVVYWERSSSLDFVDGDVVDTDEPDDRGLIVVQPDGIYAVMCCGEKLRLSAVKRDRAN